MFQRIVCVLQITDDFKSNVTGQLNVAHHSVCCVDLRLKGLSFHVQIPDDESHITENVGVNQSSQNDPKSTNSDLIHAYWRNIISSHLDNSVVDRNPVLIVAILSVEIRFWVHAVQRGLPSLVILNDYEQKTASTVQVHNDEEDQLEQLKHVFQLLSDVQSRDHFAESCNSDEFEKREQFEHRVRLACNRVDWYR